MPNPKLADYLREQMEKRSWGLKEITTHTKVSQTAIHNILNNPEGVVPKLETLSRIADAFELPLWRVIEMSGFDPGMPMDASALALRLESLKRKAPEMSEVLDHLAEYDRRDVQSVLVFLETMAARRRQASQQ